MAQDELIARRYALGLAELARDENMVEQVRGDLKYVADLVDTRAGDRYSRELVDFLGSPSVMPDDKLATVRRILEQAGIGATVGDFVGVLIERDRVELLPLIARAYADLIGGLTGEYTALVQTARPLSEDQSRRLADALSAAFGGAVHLHQQVEPGLLAGAKITVGDKTFDGSVLGRLENLKHRLVAKGWEALAAGAETGGEAGEAGD